MIDSAVEEVFRECPDMIIVVGTRLETCCTKHIANRLCRFTRYKGGVALWISLEKPSSASRLLPLLDYVVQADCDEFATLVSPGLNMTTERVRYVDNVGRKRKHQSLTRQQGIKADEFCSTLKRARKTEKNARNARCQVSKVDLPTSKQPSSSTSDTGGTALR